MRRTLRTLPLLALVLALALPGGPALAAGGSAACTVPFQIARAQQLGEASLPKGPYKLTVLDTSELDCRAASDALRRAIREPGADLPDGWKLDAPSQVVSREDGSEAFRIEPDVTDPLGGSGEDDSFWGSLEGFALTWLPIIFMGPTAPSLAAGWA